MESGRLVVAAALALALALSGGFLASAARLSPIVGYLVAGMAIGPCTPGYAAEGESIHQLADLGVVFLMFGVGLHFDLADLMAVRRFAHARALAPVIVASIAGWATGVVLRLPWQRPSSPGWHSVSRAPSCWCAPWRSVGSVPRSMVAR